MPRNVTVTFKDGSQAIYQNVPDEVVPQDVVDRATKQYNKPVKALDGGRGGGGILDRAKDIAGQAYDAVDHAMQPMRNAIGYDPESERAGREKIIADTRRRQQQDIGQQDGFFDRVGDLFTRGDIAASAGINRAASGMALSPAERDSYVRSARLEEAAGNTKIDGEATWDAVKGDWTNLPRFIAEQGVSSLPSMLQNFAGAPGFIANTASNIGSIAQSRAQADGRTDATGADVAFAAPFGAASSALDAAGLEGMVSSVGKGILTGIAKDAAIEGATEAVQSGLEYAGGSVGTKQGFDARTAAEQMLQGGLVGFGVGGAFGAVQETGNAAIDETGRLLGRRPDDTRAPAAGTRETALAEAATVTPEDQASPLDTNDIVAGRMDIADAAGSKVADNALTANGLPKVGQTVSVGNLPGGKSIIGKIEDHFSDDSGQGVVITPEGGGRPIREYLDTLNELGVTITPFNPTAEADAIDARLAAEQAIPAQETGVSSPSPAPAQEAAPPSVAARSTARGGAVNSPEAVTGFMSRVRRAESSGNDNAKNSRSSATGRYQFTDRTWLTTYRAEFGDTGESQAQILAKRGDGALQDRLMQRLTTDNARALQQSGASVTEGNLYIAHFAGAGGARAIINSQPQTPIEQVLGAKAVEANPFLKGKTTGDVVRWAAEKMGGSAPALSPQSDVATADTVRSDPYEQAMRDYRARQARQGEYTDQPSPARRDATTGPSSVENAAAPVTTFTTAKGSSYAVGEDGLTTRDKAARPEHPGEQGLQPTSESTFYMRPDDMKSLALMQAEGGHKIQIVTAGDRAAIRYVDGPDAGKIVSGTVVPIQHSPEVGLAPVELWKAGEKVHFGNAIVDVQRGPAPLQAVSGDISPQQGETAGAAVPQEPQPPRSEARVEDTATGKSVAVIDASEADRAAIAEAVPEAKPMRRKDGALVYAKKYGDQIRAALVQPEAKPGTDMAGKPIDKEWMQFAETSGTLGIPRAEMPQIKAEHRGAMVNFLNARDISHQEETVPASSLLPSQAEFSPAKVQQAKDYQGGNRAILISADNHVVDGHHQWLAARDSGEDVRAIRLNAPIRDVIQAAHEFPSSETADGATDATSQNIAGPQDGGVAATVKTPKAGSPEATAASSAGSAAGAATPARAEDTVTSEQQAQPENAAAAFKRVWKSREFQSAMKKIGDLPSPESPVAAALVNGWTDGKARDAATLESEFRQINVASPEYKPLGFNPRQGYLEGYYAAVMPEPTQIRVVGEGNGFIDASTAWARIDAKLNPEPEPSGAAIEPASPSSASQNEQPSPSTPNEATSPEDSSTQSIPASDDPVVRLTGDEVGPWSDMLDLQKKARAWYRRHLMARTITSSDGAKVNFTRAGEGKMRAGDRIMRAVPAIRAIIEQGQHEGPFPPTEKWAERGQIAAHRYTAPVEIDGQTYRFGVLVQEMKDGRRFYVLSDKPDVLGAGGRSSLIEGASQHGPKEITPGDINLFVVDQSDKSEVSSDLTDARSALEDRLGQLRLSDKVRLAIVDTLGGQAAGQYRDKLITIATDTAQGAAFKLDHEAIHALRDLGLFNTTEWAILSAAARRDVGLMRSIGQRYASLSPDARIEEAVADLFARHQDGRYEATGTVQRVFKLLRQVFEAIRNAFAGRGLRTAEGVMRDVAAGKVGARGTVGPSSASETSAPGQDRNAAPEGSDANIGGDGPKGKFSVPEQEAALNLADALNERADGEKIGAAVDYLRVRFQDRMLPVLRAQEEVSRQIGADIGENSNPYLDEELMTGRIGARMDRMMEDHIVPLLDAMRADEVELQDFEDYLYARHAPERNAQIAAINPEFSEGEGSGMTDLEAAAIMSRIRKDGKAEAMERLADRYDAMMRETMDRRVEAGLLSEEEAQAWRDTYEHYVPLRGQKEMEAGTDAPRIRRQSGISVKGKESRRAYGRRSRADDIFAHSILQAQEAIVRAEQNKVAQSFLELARSAPDPEFWTIDKVERKKRINGTTGMVEHYFDSRVAAEDAPYTVTVKVNGDEHRITMNRNNPQARDIADSMRNLSAAQTSLFVSFFGKVNRAFSAINTRFSPPFIVTNALRDVMTAMVTLKQNEDMPGLARAVFSDYRKALTAKSTGDTAWARWRREWEMAGGKVAFNQTSDLNQIKADVARKIKYAANPHMARNAWNGFFDAVEGANEAVERAIRLSVYKNARERGASPKRAASMALNVTTNFSRKGRYGPFMNSLYAFFNAGAQGNATLMIAAARSKKVRRAMGALVMFGLAQEFLNALISDDDDDGQSFYDKIPQYEKDNYFILMIPGSKGDYIKYPLAKGLNVLPGLGRNVASVMRGAQDAGQSAKSIAHLALEAFNPVSGGGSIWNFFAPTAADPFVDIWENRNFTGKPIAPQTFKGETPDNPASGYHPNASTLSKLLTRGLNELTGGDDVVPGTISWAPEVVDYAIGQITGGAGRFVGNLLDLGPALMDPTKDMTINDWPIVNRVAGHTPDWVDRSLFYQRADELATLKERLQGYAKNQDASGLQAYLAKNEDQARLIPAVDQARKWLSKGSKAKRENMKAYDDGRIDKATFESNRQLIDAGDMQVIQGFNTLWVSQIDKRGRKER